MKKKLPITKNKDVVVSWVYTWSKQQDMSIHEQRIVLRILEACQAELKGVKLKDYAGTKRKFEHGLWDVDAQMHVSDVIFPDVTTTNHSCTRFTGWTFFHLRR